MLVVLLVELHLAAVGELQDVAARHHAIPHLITGDALAHAVEPFVLLNREATLHLQRPVQFEREGVVHDGDLVPVRPAVDRVGDQVFVLGEGGRGGVLIQPALADEVAAIREVGLLRAPVPKDFPAMHALRPVRPLPRIAAAGDFQPAEADLDRVGVGVTECAIRPGRHLGLVQFAGEGFRHVLGNLAVLASHQPVGAGLRLHAEHHVDRGLDHVDDGRLEPAIFQLVDLFGGELVAVVVFALAVGDAAPGRLPADLVEEGLKAPRGHALLRRDDQLVALRRH